MYSKTSQRSCLSYLGLVLAILSCICAIIGIFTHNWVIYTKTDSRGSAQYWSYGLWKTCFQNDTQNLTCTNMTQYKPYRLSQVLSISSALVLSLISIMNGFVNSISSQNGKMKSTIIILHFLVALSTTTGILHFLNLFFYVNSKIDSSLMLILGAAFLASVSAVLYAMILGYSLQQIEEVQYHSVTLLMQLCGVLAIILAVLGIALPKWVDTIDKHHHTYGLWQHCKNAIKCSTYTEEQFRVTQVLAVIGLSILVLSVIMSIVTSFIWKRNMNAKVLVLSLFGFSVLILYAAFFWFIIVYFSIFANANVGYSGILMILSGAPISVAAGIVQAVVLGKSIERVEKF